MSDPEVPATTRRQRLRALHDQIAPLLVVPIGLLGAAALIIAAIAGVNASGASQRAESNSSANAALVKCLNEYAGLSAVSNAAVRDATVKRDTAVVVRDAALDEEGIAFLALVEALRAEKYRPVILDQLAETLRDRAEAAADLEAAQADLDAVRKAFPPVPAPAVFCDVELDDEGKLVERSSSPTPAPSSPTTKE